MAIAIPPMSDEPERVFSGARRTITWDRHRLTPKNVEMMESLSSWIKEGIVGYLELEVESVDANLEQLVTRMELHDRDVIE